MMKPPLFENYTCWCGQPAKVLHYSLSGDGSDAFGECDEHGFRPVEQSQQPEVIPPVAVVTTSLWQRLITAYVRWRYHANSDT